MTGTDIASGDLAISVCDRCRLLRPYKALKPDGQSPGLYVCPTCWDPIDPYRLPPRQPEPVALDHPRPDASLANETNYLTTGTDKDMFWANLNTEDDTRLVI